MTTLQIYKKLKQEVRKDLQKFSNIALSASKGKTLKSKDAYWLPVGDIRDLVQDYIEILRDQVEKEHILQFLHRRDTAQRELISNRVWKWAEKLKQ